VILEDRERGIAALEAQLASRDQHIANLQAHLDETVANYKVILEDRERGIAALDAQLASRDQHIANLQAHLDEQGRAMSDLEAQLSSRNQKLALCETEIHSLRNSRLFRLSATVQNGPMSLKKVVDIAYLLGAIVIPERIKAPLRGCIRRIF